MTTQLRISVGQHSDPGLKADNEDFFGITEPTEPQLTFKGITAAIADGMSGSDAGKEASHACVIGMMMDYYSTPDSWSVVQSVQKVLSATNSWLYSTGHARYESTKGLVSTLSVLILKSNTAHLFHIGDSRIYRLREDGLQRLTRDHRVTISPEKSYLSRAMGIEPHLDIDHRTATLQVEDLFILTTDGVHDFLDGKTLQQLIRDHQGDLQLAAETVVDRARANQSDDNLTCQLIRIDALPVQHEDELRRQHANLPFPPPLEPGMVLDGYRIEAELHASKRTQIYRAEDTHNGATVILKTPSLNYEDDPLYIEHFLHEEWAGKRINNDQVLKILETDRPKKSIYYVTEYIPWLTLRQWMDQNPRPDITQVIRVIEAIAKGLMAFHRMEMLHQDLKPDNIMFDGQGCIKIIDFGSVKIAGIAEIQPFQAEESVLGTLNYTAPEAMRGQRSDTRADLFSLGVIAYELFNNALPFGRDMPEKADPVKIARLQYVSSAHLNPMVPTWIDGALKKAVSLNPAQRYDELSEFVYDLQHPNSRFVAETNASLPLMQRNPLRFWQALSGLLFLSNLLFIYLLSR